MSVLEGIAMKKINETIVELELHQLNLLCYFAFSHSIYGEYIHLHPVNISIMLALYESGGTIYNLSKSTRICRICFVTVKLQRFG